MPIGRGIWLSLYDKEADNPVTLVGAGAGLEHPSIATVPLTKPEAWVTSGEADMPSVKNVPNEAPLTIAEAKRRIALAQGVSEADVKITISS